MKTTCGGRLFESFQKRIKGFLREHVHFIDDEDLVPVSGRAIAGLLFQFPDFIDAAIGSRVNFENIHAIARGDLDTGGAFAAGLARLALVTVQRLRQNPRSRRFAAAPWSGEKKCMGDPADLKGIHQSPGNMLLSYQFIEIFGPPFAGKNLILHREKGRAPGILLHI